MSKLTQISREEEDGLDRRRIHLREISGDQDLPPQTVGQELRAARLRRGDEIAQISRALKIRKDHLEALEEDRLEDLPGKTYAIGFVRSYARHLGLEAADYVERFKQEIAGRPADAAQPVAPIHQDEHRLPHGWRIVALLVALLFAGGAWHLLSSGNETSQPVPPAPVLTPPKPAAAPRPKPVAIPPQEAMPSPAADSAGSQVLEPSGEETAALPPPAAGPQSPATRATRLAPALAAQPSLQAIQPQASPAPVLAQKASASGPQTTMPAVPAVAGGTIYGEQNRGARVILRARGDSRVTVRAEDGTLYLNRDLKAGDAYQVPNLPGLVLAASDAGAIEVYLDGSTLGRVGQQQQILGRVSLDPQSLADRFHR